MVAGIIPLTPPPSMLSTVTMFPLSGVYYVFTAAVLAILVYVN
jgi:hypothetical protein